MPDAADFAIAPLIEPRPEEGSKDRTLVLNMGPQHPSTHGVLRLVLEIDGETVLRLEPDIGFLHTGIEKSCEAKFYQQVVPLTDRIDYLSPMSNNLCYCLAVEKLLRARAAAARSISPRAVERAHAHPVSPRLAGHACHGHRGPDRLSLYLSRAGRDPQNIRTRERPAHDGLLLSYRRRWRSSLPWTSTSECRICSAVCPKRSMNMKTC